MSDYERTHADVLRTLRDVEAERDQLRKVIARTWPADFRCRCGAQVVGGLSTREMADWLTEHWPHVGLRA